MYAPNPTSSVTVTPQNTATATASTEEMTEKAPLMPQYHAVGAPSFTNTALLMPNGNAIPMKKPEGKSNNAEIAIRTGVDAAVSWYVTDGLAKMNAARATGSSHIHGLIRDEWKLPQLDANRSTKSTTVRP